MNHHTRSYSEQPQVAPQVATPVGQANSGLAQPQSFIRIHSDSQQSLDQLFNPTLTSSVPLRNRNLPSSFFNPSVKTDNGTNGTPPTNVNHILGNNLHNRSISFDQRNPNVPQPHRQNFYVRTHSTLAPMPQLDSNHSSHQSSHEFLETNALNATNNNNVSSCQQHSENIVSSTSTNNHNHNHHQRHLHHLSHSNGWPSAGNSIDDLSSTCWNAGQQQPPNVVHQPMQVVQHHQPTIMHEHSVQVQPAQQEPQHQTRTNIVANNHQPMFYSTNQQTVAAADTTTTPMVATSHVCPSHSLHNRSLSYQQQPAAISEVRVNHGFHMRTHSTVAPMSNTCHRHHQQAISHHSSHQSSQELLDHSSATNSSAAAGWSSSGYSTDDMTSAGVGHSWGPNHNSHKHPSQIHMTQQPMPQPPAATSLTTLPTGHNHLHHHHHIPLQVQQQNAHQQQLFYNV